MKNFRTLSDAKKDLCTIAEYIKLIESYQPCTLLEHAVHIYAHEGNLQRTADCLNKMGFKLDGHSIEAKDVSTFLLNKPSKGDLLHKEIRRLYRLKAYPPKKYRGF